MKETLIVVGVVVAGMAFRATRIKWLRKAGVLAYITATGVLGYFLTGFWWLGVLFALAWFFFPWVELLFSVRKMRLPLENKLSRQSLPCENHFPGASSIRAKFLESGYEHISDCGWDWAQSHEHYSFFWHKDKKHLVAICHRIQSCVTFCYLNITSTTSDGTLWRTTNFPFSSALPPSPTTQFNHLTEGCVSCPDHVLFAHESFLYDKGIDLDTLSDRDMANVERVFEHEAREQIDHNLQRGLICLTGDGHFRYSFKGLNYLWLQILKDMYRLC